MRAPQVVGAVGEDRPLHLELKCALQQLAVHALDIALDVHVLGDLAIEPVLSPPVEVDPGRKLRQSSVEPRLLAAADTGSGGGHVQRDDQHPSGHVRR